MSKTPYNWIQGMSYERKFGAERKAEVNYSHMNKLRILHRIMNKWEKDNGQVSMDSQMGRMFESDLQTVEELVERGTTTMLEDDKEFLGTDQFLTRMRC